MIIIGIFAALYVSLTLYGTIILVFDAGNKGFFTNLFFFVILFSVLIFMGAGALIAINDIWERVR